MKTFKLIQFALISAATLFTQTALAEKPGPTPPPPSSGTLLLDYLYPGENWGLTVAPSGTIFASGIASDGSTRARVLLSSDTGSTWSLVDDFPPPGRSVWWWDVPGAITSDAVGNVYVAGATVADEGSRPFQWYVRRSTDGGAIWTTVDDFALGTSGDVTGIAVDAAGDVYVSGMADDISGKWVWAIRKGVGGTLFSTVDVMPNSYVAAVFAHPTAGVFAVGDSRFVVTTRNNTTTSRAWLVRRSLDGGATWSNVDTFQLSSSLYSSAQGIGAGHWIVKKY